MTSRFKPLLPAEPSGFASSPNVSALGRKQRSVVLIACSACQKAKSKCSGHRPVCNRCSAKNILCEYEVEANQTRASSRRKVEEQLRELYTYLQARPWNEALEILRRIRETPDPLDVVSLVKAGDLLLHKTLLEGRDDTTTIPRGPGARHPSLVQPPPCSPWTTITDDGTVQNLISVFFEKDQRFLMSFIDRDMFLRDMEAKPQRPHNGWFCSAVLVNAICAMTACHCRLITAANFTSTRDLAEAFFTKVKVLLDLEAGKPSLPTAQALLIMFSYSCCMGRDRAGNMFRAAAYEMMERMMPKIERILSNNTCPADSRKAISRAMWGMYCFDSICSSVYLRPSLFPAPNVPRPYGLVAKLEHSQIELEAEASARAGPSEEHEGMALRYACDLSEIFNKALDHEVRRDRPDRARTSSLQLAQLYRELQTLQSKLPAEEGYQGNNHREHCHLWAYHHVVAANIARLQRSQGTRTPSPLDCLTDVCVHHCQSIIKHIDRHLTRYPSERQGSLTTLYFAYTCTITLVDLVGTSASAAQTFSRTCQIFHEATEYPLSNLLLEGLAAVAKQLGMQLPAGTAPYFSKLNVAGLENENIPLGFVIPIRAQLLKVLGDIEWDLDPEEARIELGDVLAQSRAGSSCK